MLPVDPDLQPMAGYTVTDDGGEVNCDPPSRSDVAVSDNVYYCSPNAASANVCWGRPGSTDLLCGWDPRSKELHLNHAALPLGPLPARTAPAIPWALDLADGTQCIVRNGGAWGSRPDGYTGA